MASPNFDLLNVRLAREINDPVATATTNGDSYTSAQRDQWLNNAHRRWVQKRFAARDWNALKGYTNRETKSLIGAAISLAAPSSTDAVVFDAAFTISSTTVTNFTGVLAAHVGAQFIGTDAGGNAFKRTISTYVSSTSFTIDSAVTSAGSCTNGYIVPQISSTLFTGGVAYIINATNVTQALPMTRMPEGLAPIPVGSSINRYTEGTTSNVLYSLENDTLKQWGGALTDTIQLTYVRKHTDLSSGGSSDTLIPSEYFNEVLDEAVMIAYEEDPSNATLAKLQLKKSNA